MWVGTEAVELAHMATFVEVVKHASFTKAALRLNVDTSVVSRRISELERRLGVPLLDRSSRRVRSTDVGGAYYAKCLRVLQAVEQANDFAASFNTQMSGRLRIVLPSVLCTPLLAGLLKKFSSAYPDILLETTSMAGDVEGALAEENGFDIAVQIGCVRASNLIAKPLTTLRYSLCASPAYLDAHGRPASPAALRGHVGLIELPHGLGERWRLVVDGEEHEVPVRECMRGNDVRLLVASAEAGLGIVLAPEPLVVGSLAAGRLESLLPECVFEPRPVTALYPTSRRYSQKVQALLTCLSEGMAPPRPGLDKNAQPAAAFAADGSFETYIGMTSRPPKVA